ncbi:hypothetical protein ABK040_009152 [Willaertia magna]
MHRGIPTFSLILSYFLLLSLSFIHGIELIPKIKKTGSSTYSLTMKRMNGNQPVINFYSPQSNSNFLYNYNVAYFPHEYSTEPRLVPMVVRVQNLTDHPTNIYDVGPSLLSFTIGVLSDDYSSMRVSMLDEDSVILSPTDSNYQQLGVEDPRIVYVNGTYYMFYTAVTKNTKGDIIANLALGTLKESNYKLNYKLKRDTNYWKLQGLVFPELNWSKSGALLPLDKPIIINNVNVNGYLFYGDSDIWLATTSDFLNYNNTGKVFINRRLDSFDSELVESGPPPVKLSDGNYLFLYNSARKVNIPNPKNYELQYNLGYVILDGKNPLNIIERSSQPIFSPTLDWERCDNNSGIWGKRGLTPNVIFVEGMKKIFSSSKYDQFIVLYQGCDSFTSYAMLTINF